MYPILKKTILGPQLFEMEIQAPLIARKARPGQFCILLAHEKGERVPFTLADWDTEKGSITLVIQVTGKTSHYLLKENLSSLPHVNGPLGEPFLLHPEAQEVFFVAGGLGMGAVYPIMKAYRQTTHVRITAIAGFRGGNRVFWEDRFREMSDEAIITTEDGSLGRKCRVTLPLEEMLNQRHPSFVYAVGPLPMMKEVSEITKPYKIKTYVSLNPIMVDGIGMCGACRVTVDGKTRYACIEGPNFDAHEVDFDELILRNRQFQSLEEACYREYLAEKNYHDHQK